jgi:hypothetical protein
LSKERQDDGEEITKQIQKPERLDDHADQRPLEENK